MHLTIIVQHNQDFLTSELFYLSDLHFDLFSIIYNLSEGIIYQDYLNYNNKFRNCKGTLEIRSKDKISLTICCNNKKVIELKVGFNFLKIFLINAKKFRKK